MQGLSIGSFLPGILDTAFKIGESVLTTAVEIGEEMLQGIGIEDKQGQSGGDVLDIQKSAIKDEQDKFVKTTETENKEKTEKDNEINKKHNNIMLDIQQFQNEHFGDTYNLLDEMADSNFMSKSSVSIFKDLIDNVVNDFKSNPATTEAFRSINEKIQEVDNKLAEYRNSVKTNEGNLTFSLNTQTDIYHQNNPLRAKQTDTAGYQNPYYDSAEKVVDKNDKKSFIA